MAFGGSSEINLIASGAAFGRGVNIWSRVTSDESTDFQNVTGYFTGIGAQSTDISASVCGGGGRLGLKVGDILIHTETTGGTKPGRVTWHSVIASTANFSTASYSSTGGFDCTLSNSSTA